VAEIHRQAAGAQPLRLATAIREGERVAAEPFDMDAVAEADVVICARNRTRRQLNRLIRRDRGIADKDPVIGDRIVCLRNNYATRVLNGTLWTVSAIERDGFLLQMQLVDDIGDEVAAVAHDDGFHCSRLGLQRPPRPVRFWLLPDRPQESGQRMGSGRSHRRDAQSRLCDDRR
jgi:hypothetical protein